MSSKQEVLAASGDIDAVDISAEAPTARDQVSRTSTPPIHGGVLPDSQGGSGAIQAIQATEGS